MIVLYAVIPILLNAAVGYFLARREVFDQAFFSAFSRLTFRYFIPLLLFSSMARAELAPLDEIGLYWIAYFGPAIVLFLLVRLFASSTISLSVTYANTVLIGIPLTLAAFGEAGLSRTLTIISANGLTLFTMVALTGGAAITTSAIAASATTRSVSRIAFVRPLIDTIRNPIIVGLLLGAMVNFLAIPIFSPLFEAISLAGQAALPCALLILGASLATVNAEAIHEARLMVMLMCVLKLLISPLLVWLVAQWVVTLDPLTISVLVTLAACPCGINALPFARDERETRVVSAAIFVSTLLSIVTLPAWVYALTLFLNV